MNYKATRNWHPPPSTPALSPSVAYTDPEVAWVGLTEDQAKAQGIKVKKGLFPWTASGRAIANGRDEGVTKLLFDDSPRSSRTRQDPGRRHGRHHTLRATRSVRSPWPSRWVRMRWTSARPFTRIQPLANQWHGGGSGAWQAYRCAACAQVIPICVRNINKLSLRNTGGCHGTKRKREQHLQHALRVIRTTKSADELRAAQAGPAVAIGAVNTGHSFGHWQSTRVTCRMRTTYCKVAEQRQAPARSKRTLRNHAQMDLQAEAKLLQEVLGEAANGACW